jgi:succinoglycan biosynthesis transport protein ExoP
VTPLRGEPKGLIRVDLHDYVRILRKRWPIILVAFVLGGAAAAAYAFRATPVYAGHIQLFVTTPSGGDDTTGLQQGNTFTQERVKSYADIVSSPKPSST